MRTLKVYIDICGAPVHIGNIRANNSLDARFSYAEDYLYKIDARPISISLPLSENEFSAESTKNFFEGLLPEGFTRRTIASFLHYDSNDYLSILSSLGQECLGAIRIVEDEYEQYESGYNKLSIDTVKRLAKDGVVKSAEFIAKSHLSLTGASGKVGLYFDKANDEWYFPEGDATSTHIVKQSHVRLDSIVLNEQLALKTAEKAGIRVPNSFIVNTGNNLDEDVLFASERFDRFVGDDNPVIDGLVCPYRLHQEDFAQILGIAPVNKYETVGSEYMMQMFDILRKHSANPIEDQFILWDIIVFDFLIGNTDNHIKNYSVLYSENLKSLRLAPAYDILSTSIYSASTRNMAFNIGGKYSVDEIGREDFMLAAKKCKIGDKVSMKHFDNICNAFEKAIENATEELYQQGFSNVKEIRDRMLNSGGYKNLK